MPYAHQTPPAVLLVGTSDYLPFARVQMESLRRFHPEWPVFFCLIDPVAGKNRSEPFQILEAPWLKGKEGALTLFQYRPLELTGMCRPRALLELLNRGYSRVLYFDLDISFHSPLTPFIEALEKSAIVLTPHLLKPSTVKKAEESENNRRLTGLVNSGCLAVREHHQTRQFLEWWSARTLRHGHMDQAGGFFNEQSWIEHALAFYGEAALLRHEGVNVAWWNSGERPLSQRPDGSFMAADKPLVCFHWSGYQPENPGSLNYATNTPPIPPDSGLFHLALEYRESLERHGAKKPAVSSYPYHRLSDGTAILSVWREAVRQRHADLVIPDDPFLASPTWLRQLKTVSKKLRYARKDWILKENKKKRGLQAISGRLIAAWKRTGASGLF